MAVIVSSLSDSGAGTLRQAITDINAATATSPITFSVTGTITLASALPAINKNLTITGPGLSSLTISGNDLYRIFYLNTGFTISISGLTISNGRAATAGSPGSYGGGIYNAGSTLTIDSCYFTGCYAGVSGTGTGGAIYTIGTTTITNTSFVSNNIASGGGSAIYAAGSGTLTVGNSTFSSNTTTAILHNVVSTIYNCTFYNNLLGLYAGAIAVFGNTTTILSSTISGNSTTGGSINDPGAGGVFVSEYSGIVLKNSIISGNTGGNDFSSYQAAKTFNSAASNIIGTISTASATSAARVIGDPLLGALQNNGGSTQTMAVGAGSPAINAGNAAASNASPVSGLDQTGRARSATTPTIGAVEYVAATTTTTTTTTPAPSTFNFPASPSTGQVYTFNGIIWVWNGIGWKKRLILPSQDIFMSSNYGGL